MRKKLNKVINNATINTFTFFFGSSIVVKNEIIFIYSACIIWLNLSKIRTGVC